MPEKEYERERTEDGDREEDLFMKRKLGNQIKDGCLQEDDDSDSNDFFEVLSKEQTEKYIQEERKNEEEERKNFERRTIKDENDISKVLPLDRETHLLDENNRKTTEKQQKNLGGANSLVVSKQEDDDSDSDDFFKVLSKEQTAEYLEEVRKNEEEKRIFERRTIKDENDISKVLPLDRETHLLDENNRKTTEKQQKNLGGANSLVVSKQEDDDSDSDDFFNVLSKEQTAEYLEEVRKNEEEKIIFERRTIKHKNGISEVLPLEREAHSLYENNRETREKQERNLGGANPLGVLKQEISRKDDVIFSFDPVSSYSRSLINGGISSDSAINYCILRNIDTGFFHYSNSETAVKLKRFYTTIQKFTNCPFERIIEYWEDLVEIQLMVEDNKDINDDETDNVGLDCEILNTNLGEKHIDNEAKTIGKKISGDNKRETTNITTEETLEEIQDTSAVSGLRQLLKSNKSDYVDESVTQYLRMRDDMEDAKVIL